METILVRSEISKFTCTRHLFPTVYALTFMPEYSLFVKKQLPNFHVKRINRMVLLITITDVVRSK